MFLRHNRADRLTSSFIYRIFNNVTNRHLSRTYYRRMKQVSNVTSIDQHAMFPLIGDQYTTFSLILWRQFIWNAAKAIYMEYRESASGLFHKTCLEKTLCYVLKWLFRFKLVRYRLISNCAKLKSQAYRQLVCRSQFIVDLSFIFQCCV